MKWGAFYRQSKKIKYKGTRRKKIDSFTKEQWDTLCGFFNNKCPKCGKEVKEFTVDHIKPLSLGGTNNIENIQPLCFRCNVRKSNLYIVDYRPENVKGWIKGQY